MGLHETWKNSWEDRKEWFNRITQSIYKSKYSGKSVIISLPNE